MFPKKKWSLADSFQPVSQAGHPNQRHFGKDRLYHCIAFATFLPLPANKTLQIYYVIQRAISVSSAFIYSSPCHHSRPHSLLLNTKTISLGIKYTLPGSPPSQLSLSSSLSFFFWGERKENFFSGYVVGSAHELAIYFLLGLTLPGP